MYNFIDTTEASAGAFLPSEALCINGEYIENLVTGYRTLTVTGRESLSPVIDTYETGARDGVKLKNKRYPERIIIVKYQLVAESCEAFRDAYNKLGGVLDVTGAQLIFNDEQDKFYIGTPSAIGEVDPGLNAVVGEFEILCTDPFKYSVEEYEAESQQGETSILIDYNGTYKAFPKLEANFHSETEVAEDGETAGALTGNGDCGFVAFFTENENVVQLGDPDEVDGSDEYAKAQTLMNQTFLTNTAWGTTAKSLWAVNGAGGLIPSNFTQAGSVAMGVASYATSEETTAGTVIKTKTSTGSPLVNYVVTYKTTDRTATSVKVTAIITTSLEASSSGIGTNRELEAALLIGGSWRSVTIKKPSTHWQKGKTYTTNLTVTVTGLSTTTTKLTGIKFKVDRKDTLGQAGILAAKSCNDIAISTYTANEPGEYYLQATSYGTSTAWHGPTITRTLSADASGEIGAKNFSLTYKQKFCISNGSSGSVQMGGFQMQLLDTDGSSLAGVRIWKNTTGATGKIACYVNGVQVYVTERDISFNNAFFGHSAKAVYTSTVTKSGNTIVFNIAGIKKTITDDAVADKKAVKVVFAFEQYGTATPIKFNGLYIAKLVKNNCDTWKDVPNKFSANDVVIADCNTGEIFLNGSSAPDLGALGNEWEEFYLKPGFNLIGFAYSSWVQDEYAPAIKVRYREVYL